MTITNTKWIKGTLWELNSETGEWEKESEQKNQVPPHCQGEMEEMKDMKNYEQARQQNRKESATDLLEETAKTLEHFANQLRKRAEDIRLHNRMDNLNASPSTFMSWALNDIQNMNKNLRLDLFVDRAVDLAKVNL